MAHIICIAGQKGGTGKTTTAINLAASLALHEQRTLLIDADPQGSATTGMGINKQALSKDLYQVLAEKASIASAALDSRLDFLKIVPARFKLIHIESRLAATPGAEKRLQQRLAACADRFDYIIIDTPASLGFLTVCALVASEQVLIPFQYQVFALEGLVQLLLVVQKIRRKINPRLRIAGILLTMCERFESGGRAIGSLLPGELSPAVLTTVIPFDKTVQEASNRTMPVALYDIKAKGSRAYLRLAAEVLQQQPPGRDLTRERAVRAQNR